MKKIAIIIFIGLMTFLLLDQPHNEPHGGLKCDVPSVTVQKGDTLWAITATHCGGERDNDLKIKIVAEMNNDVFLLDPGMIIILPQ